MVQKNGLSITVVVSWQGFIDCKLLIYLPKDHEICKNEVPILVPAFML